MITDLSVAKMNLLENCATLFVRHLTAFVRDLVRILGNMCIQSPSNLRRLLNKEWNRSEFQYVPTLIVMDSFRDTNTVACSRSSVVVDAIVEVVDASAFVAACDQTNVVVFDPKVLDFVDLSLNESRKKIKNWKFIIISIDDSLRMNLCCLKNRCCSFFSIEKISFQTKKSIILIIETTIHTNNIRNLYQPGDNSDTGVLDGVGLWPVGWIEMKRLINISTRCTIDCVTQWLFHMIKFKESSNEV